jgi:hypothetical protein
MRDTSGLGERDGERDAKNYSESSKSCLGVRLRGIKKGMEGHKGRGSEKLKTGKLILFCLQLELNDECEHLVEVRK